MQPEGDGEATEERSGTGVLQAISALWRGPPAYVAVTGWSPLGAVLAAACFVVVADLVAALAFGFSVMGILPRLSQWRSVHPATAYQLASITSQAVIVVLTLSAARAAGCSARDALALGPPAGGRLTYVTGAALCLLVVINAEALISLVAPSQAPITRHTSHLAFVLDAAAAIVGAAVGEELLFRAFLTAALARSPLGYAGAAVVTSAVWSGMHYTYPLRDMAVLFVMGLFLSWLLWRTGSIRGPILCHACVGAVAFFSGTTLVA